MRGVLTFGLATVTAIAPALQAQPALTPRWPAQAVIRVWLDPRTTPPGAGAFVARALATWTRAAGSRFTLQKVAAPDAAQIRVRFAQADGLYGETRPRVDRVTGVIVSADVLIVGDIAGDSLQQRIVTYLTALHELGHALGLPHTREFEDIMYSFRRPDDGARYFGAYRKRLRSSEDIGTDRATGLSRADLTALRELYDR